MVDELYDRQYQAKRSELNASIYSAASKFAAGLANAFKVLNRIEYSSPWKTSSDRARSR